MIHASTLAYEPTPFGQLHELDFHGDDGALHCRIDWDAQQLIRGAKRGAPFEDLTIPEAIWAGARRDTVHNTYRDVFRTQDTMARRWVTAIAHQEPVWPDFAAGATIQRVMDAAILSHEERRWVETEEIVA
ncbi:MAG: hypothetical protein IPK16_29030 [Anaerolineales bacterium]|nr:hypothetical protein [Anaerolineales bacterium]